MDVPQMDWYCSMNSNDARHNTCDAAEANSTNCGDKATFDALCKLFVAMGGDRIDLEGWSVRAHLNQNHSLSVSCVRSFAMCHIAHIMPHSRRSKPMLRPEQPAPVISAAVRRAIATQVC
jgi:hypothetical protein